MQESRSQDSPSSSRSLWEKSLGALQSELDPQIYSAYIKPLRLSSFNEESAEFLITAPSRLVCNHVDRNFGERLSRILSEKLGVDEVTVRFAVEKDQASDASAPASSPYIVVKKVRTPLAAVSGAKETDGTASGLNPKYTFASFVVGNSNQFCHAAAMRVAEQPGLSYNPLFIYGGVGLGKTHILHAIGNAVLQRNPRANVLYLSSETFTNELIHSLRHAKMDQFKNQMRRVELLLLDDIQFMCGKERTQEEFFHTFNALYGAKHQIVITSDKLPQEIPGIEERLLTRFSWGLTADLQAPEFETRVAILKRKATLEGFELPEGVAHWIAEQVSSNVRELEGALTRLHAITSLQNTPMTIEGAQNALKPLLRPKTVHITTDDIKKAVAAHFGIKLSDMVSKRRTRTVSFPRHIAMYLCRKHTTASYPEIGAQFGGRDHSSVIHAANVVSGKIAADTEVKNIIKQIEKKIVGY